MSARVRNAAVGEARRAGAGRGCGGSGTSADRERALAGGTTIPAGRCADLDQQVVEPRFSRSIVVGPKSMPMPPSSM
jgi:hypothetical protein